MNNQQSYGRAVARIDCSAIEYNCRLLKQCVGPNVELCAVVKADGYGHGMVEVAKAAIGGGTTWLAVAAADEVVELREHGIELPVLVMGALTRDDLDIALSNAAEITVWDREFLAVVASRAAELELVAAVHIKYDSGMGRLGSSDPQLVEELCAAAESGGSTELKGLMTHFATADEPGSEFLQEQLRRFESLAKAVKVTYPSCKVHAANSAATISDKATHFDSVRCGIAVYGLDPFQSDPAAQGLRPALSLESYVAALKEIKEGESVGYGRTWTATKPTYVAVLPIGYGDGVRRGLSNKGEVLVAGVRYPLVGTVSMDNVTAMVGPEPSLAVGEKAVLIGSDGDETILAEDLAAQLDTINYEITCGISQRVDRIYQ